jgi:hypothetical protein
MEGLTNLRGWSARHHHQRSNTKRHPIGQSSYFESYAGWCDKRHESLAADGVVVLPSSGHGVFACQNDNGRNQLEFTTAGKHGPYVVHGKVVRSATVHLLFVQAARFPRIHRHRCSLMVILRFILLVSGKLVHPSIKGADKCRSLCFWQELYSRILSCSA